MRDRLQKYVAQFAKDWCTREDQSHLWREPIVKFADAHSPRFADLRKIVDSAHHLPQDFLPNANAVISIFLPFNPELAAQNRDGKMAAQSWVDAYNQTNAMASELCEALAQHLIDQGWRAGVVTDAGMISNDNPRSRWSQRHVAHLAGQGTWGVNNMLISDVGCVGRYFSLVAELPVEEIGSFDAPLVEERCLYRQNGSCLVCARKCVNGALTAEGFDRFLCLDQCLINERELGADVCGKCTIGLPCSHAMPGPSAIPSGEALK